MPLWDLYGYVSALTRPVTYRSETEGAAMPRLARTRQFLDPPGDLPLRNRGGG